MATPAISAVSNANNNRQIDLAAIEDASADLCVADVFVSAAEGFCNDVRGWLTDLAAPNRAAQSLIELDTMLMEVRDKIATAKGKVDGFVGAAFLTQRGKGG